MGCGRGGSCHPPFGGIRSKKRRLYFANTTRYILKGEEISANNLEEFTNALSSIHPEEKIIFLPSSVMPSELI